MDVGAIIEFYGRFFGTRVIHQFERDDGSCYGVMLLLGRHSMLEIFEDRELPSLDKFDCVQKTHICIYVDDIEKSFQRFPLDVIVEPLRRGRTDHVPQFRVRDPAGNQIEVQSFDEKVRFNRLSADETRDLVRRCNAAGFSR
jgi:catechol 2,3-dioxygenase-like lactoylglutathione lyase family enzyme